MSETRTIEVTAWYLELRHPSELRGRAVPRPDVAVIRAEVPSPEFARFLYTAVGGAWYWTDRLGWDYERWRQRLARDAVENWVLYVAGTPAGYVELEAHPEGDVEIVQFGLLPQFIGQGLGGYLLTVGVGRAWARGARRVWLHTCSLDGPHALANYQARGFRIYREATGPRAIPDEPPGPWPGAYTSPTTT